MKISASIYASPYDDLTQTIRELDDHHVDLFHVDCNDDPAVFDDIPRVRALSRKPIDLHLITDAPERYYDLIRHHGVEYVTLQHEVLRELPTLPTDLPTSWGLSFTSESNFETFADPYDFVLFMATTPGQSGGRFNKLNFQRIRAFRRQFPGKRVHVDGGVNAEVSFILRNLNVYAAVVGSYLFKKSTLGSALLDLRTREMDSHYCVRDFMREREHAPVLPAAGLTFATALRAIEDFNLGFLMLTDADGRLAGLVTNADVRRGLLRHLDDLNALRAEEIVNPHPVVIEETATVEAMLRFIKSCPFPISYLPVVNGDRRVTGCLTFSNLIKGEL